MKIYYAAIYIYMLNYTLYSLDVIWYNRFLWKSVLVSEVLGHHRGHRLLLALHMRVILLTYTFCPTLPYCSYLLTGTLCSGFASMMHYIAMNILNIGLWLICAITAISMCLGWLISYCAIVAKLCPRPLGMLPNDLHWAPCPSLPSPKPCTPYKKKKRADQ